jgi:hypothetical protein
MSASVTSPERWCKASVRRSSISSSVSSRVLMSWSVIAQVHQDIPMVPRGRLRLLSRDEPGGRASLRRC